MSHGPFGVLAFSPALNLPNLGLTSGQVTIFKDHTRHSLKRQGQIVFTTTVTRRVLCELTSTSIWAKGLDVLEGSVGSGRWRLGRGRHKK